MDKQYFKTFRRTYKNFSSKDFFKIAGPKENIDTIIERHSRESEVERQATIGKVMATWITTDELVKKSTGENTKHIMMNKIHNQAFYSKGNTNIN